MNYTINSITGNIANITITYSNGDVKTRNMTINSGSGMGIPMDTKEALDEYMANLDAAYINGKAQEAQPVIADTIVLNKAEAI